VHSAEQPAQAERCGESRAVVSSRRPRRLGLANDVVVSA
jgi:hypothetical protein